MRKIDFFQFFSVANIMILLLLVLVIAVVMYYSLPIFTEGALIRVLSISAWDPNQETYGILFALGGTIMVALIAILISGVLSVSTAFFIVEIAPYRLRPLLETIVDLGAVIPSVIYGLWGLLFLAPALRDYVMRPLTEYFPWLRDFLGSYSPSGVSILTAGVLLGVMIYPFATSIIREAIKLIPFSIKEALYSLGLNKWEVITQETRFIIRSILAALMIAFGRAVGETVAVAMVVGNVPNPLFYMIFRPGYTISSLIANQFLNATEAMLPVLYFSALVLVLLGFAINVSVMLVMKQR
ncbi:MAG: phosphate ABC transporter permease subunit PstC [Sulfolobales archaeon]